MLVVVVLVLMGRPAGTGGTGARHAVIGRRHLLIPPVLSKVWRVIAHARLLIVRVERITLMAGLDIVCRTGG